MRLNVIQTVALPLLRVYFYVGADMYTDFHWKF